MFHRDDPRVPVGPLLEACNEHIDAGRIRAFGASNWTHERIAEANEYARDRGLRGFAVSSPNYGLAEQVQDPWGEGCVSISGPGHADARKWYHKTQMPVLAYSSLARGLFSGRVRPRDGEGQVALLDRACRTAYCYEVNFQRLDRAMRLAQEKQAAVPQIALAYALNSKLNTFPIVGVATGAEFAENLWAFEIHLTPRERQWLDLALDER
jgi:aryl-alcohol dehydrogenase-like predicted oxidoreductase